MLVFRNHFAAFPYIFGFERYFFNEPPHLKTQQGDKQVFTFLEVQNHTVLARLSVFIDEDQRAYSPARATFGGIESVLSESTLCQFMTEVLNYLDGLGITNLRIVSPPACYNLEQNQIQTRVFQFLGFKLLHQDQNFHIQIGAESLSMHVSKKRKLRQCQRSGYRFLSQDTPVSVAYRFIVLARQNRQIPMSISEQLFSTLFESFPDKYQIFSLYHETILLACLVGVQVSERSLYVFLPASNPDYHKHSPMVMLMYELYEHCQRVGYELLDWGIATQRGEENTGLMRFKREMGGIPSERNTWERGW